MSRNTSLLCRLSILVLALLMPLVASAAEGADAAAQLASRLESYKTFKADFTQTVIDRGGSTVQQTQGKMVAKRPGYFYWHTQPPLEQVIVADGKNVKVYDPDLLQVTVHTMDNRLSATPALLLSGNVDGLDKAYNVSRDQQGSQVSFTLVPRNPDSLFESLTLSFSGDTLQEMRLKDSLDQNSRLRFNNVITNAKVADDTFALHVPDGVDVIRDAQ